MGYEAVIDSEGMYAFPELDGTQAFELNEDGSAKITDYPVFRAGTFRDSQGRKRSWNRDDLTQMVDHFNTHRDDYPNPPVREDHSRSIASVVGYVDNLKVRDDSDVLLADFSLTEPKAIDRWKRKTYRGRSSEIGAWRAGKNVISPFFLGFAFVDIPAVSRLYSSSSSEAEHLYLEAELSTDTDTRDDLDEGGELEPGPTAMHKFTIDGIEVENYEAVQAHITALETFRDETRNAHRADFVEKLIISNRVPAPAKDQTLEFVQTLSDDQFVAWKASMELTQPLEIFGAGGISGTESDSAREEREGRALEFATVSETVRMHRLSGMDEETLKQTASYKRMTELEQENKNG